MPKTTQPTHNGVHQSAPPAPEPTIKVVEPELHLEESDQVSIDDFILATGFSKQKGTQLKPVHTGNKF